MKDTQAVVQRVRRVNDHYQHVDLWVDASLNQMKPGHSLLVRSKMLREENIWHPYLRDQWWPVGMGNNRIVIELPVKQAITVGDVFDVLGPVGKPFRFRRSLRRVLLLAYDTPPLPLLMSIPWLLGNNVGVTMVLLGSAGDYGTRHLPPEVEVVRGDDVNQPLDWPDQVMTIGWADQVLAVVAPDDEMLRFSQLWAKFAERRADLGKNYLFGVFQSLLPCGVGACEACLVRVRDEGDKYICSDGPAFDLATLRLPG